MKNKKNVIKRINNRIPLKNKIYVVTRLWAEDNNMPDCWVKTLDEKIMDAIEKHIKNIPWWKRLFTLKLRR